MSYRPISRMQRDDSYSLSSAETGDTMSSGANQLSLPEDIVEELQAIGLRVTQGVPAFRALKTVLTADEWRRAEADLGRFFDRNGIPTAEAKRPP